MNAKLNRIYWTWRYHLQRWQRAFEYARLGSRMSEGTAMSILCDCEMPAGCFPLVTLTTKDVLTDVEDLYKPDPRLHAIAADAASYVANKWNSSGHECEAAREWAIEKFQEYAKQNGVTLVQIEEEITS